jgi:thymidylate synthase
MSTINCEYEELMRLVFNHGSPRQDRTKTGTLSTFGYQMRFNLADGFPLVTTKKVNFKAVVAELLWFLSGDTNVKALQEQGVHIWDEWAAKDGYLGPIYGKQWVSWTDYYNGLSIDQITKVVDEIKTNPQSRRLIVSAWNVAELDEMALAPCHILFQFYVEDGKLSCQLYQRSADIFLGLPFNIASYSLLTHMIAQQCDLKVGEFIWTGGDCHIYSNHIEQCSEQLKRDPRPMPTLLVPSPKPASIFDYKPEDFSLLNYNPHPWIPAPVAV